MMSNGTPRTEPLSVAGARARNPARKRPPLPCDSRRAAEQLRAHASDLRAKAQAVLDQERDANTWRRANMAASVRGRARADLAAAATLDALADAHEAGRLAGTFIGRLRARTELDTLDRCARAAWRRWADAANHRYEQAEPWPLEREHIAHAQMPRLHLDEQDRRRLAQLLSERPDTRDLGERIAGAETVAFEDARAAAKIESRETKYLTWMFQTTVNEIQRLRRLGIFTDESLRTALAEYAPLKRRKREESAVERLERELIGSKPGIDLFPTPPPLAARLAREARILPGMAVLEPSAGKGDLLDAIRALEPSAQLTAVERSHTLCALLEAKGYPVIQGDFLAHVGAYDRIVMNPPFSDNQDIHHVLHAFALLKPGGRLVSIMGSGAFFRQGRTESAFRDWLIHADARQEALPEGSFASAFRPTGVSTYLVAVDKPAAPDGR